MERRVGVDKRWQEAFPIVVPARYAMTETLPIGHSERQLKVAYLNEHNAQSSLSSDVYTTEHLLNVLQIKLNATLASKFNSARPCCHGKQNSK